MTAHNGNTISKPAGPYRQLPRLDRLPKSPPFKPRPGMHVDNHASCEKGRIVSWDGLTCRYLSETGHHVRASWSDLSLDLGEGATPIADGPADRAQWTPPQR